MTDLDRVDRDGIRIDGDVETYGFDQYIAAFLAAICCAERTGLLGFAGAVGSG